MTKEQRLAFIVGSFTGLLQCFIGIAATTTYGPVAGFFASWGTFLLLFKGYKWALGPTEETKP